MDDDDDRRRKPPSSRRGTQIDDLPSCLIMDIFLRLPTPSLLRCRIACRSWHLVFSDPLFVRLHLARSLRSPPPYFIRVSVGEPMKFYSSYCRTLVATGRRMSSQAADNTSNKYTCINSSNGLLCLENYTPPGEVYVCNPILGQYITIKTGHKERVRFYLGFSSRSNQFKVLQISSPHTSVPYLARVYTIGDGTGRWKSIGIAPSYPYRFGGFLNGSIHWVDVETEGIFYFNFDGEQFGWLPSPSLPDGRIRYAIMGVSDGCLFFHALLEHGFWMMKEYGVEESWTKIFSIDDSGKLQLREIGTTYNPSFISLQDVAKGEHLTMIS